MIILYLLFLDYDRVTRTELVEEVEKSLEILNSMETIHVARSCAHLVHEMLQAAKMSAANRARRRDDDNHGATREPDPALLLPRTAMPSHPSVANQGELLSSLIDFDPLGDFAGLGDLNMYLNGSAAETFSSAVPPRLQGDQPGALFGGANMFANSIDFLRGTENGVWTGVFPPVDSDAHDPFRAFFADTWT